MTYKSVSETAKEWGISTRRVLKLAGEGRIEGALQIGSRWVIPAKATKPQDRRRKTAVPESKCNGYRFPLFFYSVTDEENSSGSFTEEENAILYAYLHYERYELTECIAIMEKQLKATDNQYMIISILYILVYAYHDNCNYKESVQAFHKLKLALSQADHQEELELIFHEVDALFNGSDWYATSFSLDFSHHYSEEFLIYCSALVPFIDASHLFSENPILNTASNELLCQWLETRGCYFAAMLSHYYLSLSHSFKGDEDMTSYHLQSSFETAEKYRTYSSLLYIIANSPNYEKIIRRYSSEENAEKLISITESLKTAHRNFLRYLGRSTFNLDLTPDNYKYISYAMKGCTNKEMAEKESTSLYNVKKNLSLLYKKFKVTSRKELLEKIYNSPL